MSKTQESNGTPASLIAKGANTLSDMADLIKAADALDNDLEDDFQDMDEAKKTASTPDAGDDDDDDDDDDMEGMSDEEKAAMMAKKMAAKKPKPQMPPAEPDEDEDDEPMAKATDGDGIEYIDATALFVQIDERMASLQSLTADVNQKLESLTTLAKAVDTATERLGLIFQVTKGQQSALESMVKAYGGIIETPITPLSQRPIKVPTGVVETVDGLSGREILSKAFNMTDAVGYGQMESLVQQGRLADALNVLPPDKRKQIIGGTPA